MSLITKKVYINNNYTQSSGLFKIIGRFMSAQYFNQKAFGEFKGVFQNKDIVLVAAGPSVKNFIPIKNAIYIGVNRSCLLDTVKFDFLFSIDLLGISSFMEEFKNYKGNNCIKFIGEQQEGKGRDIPESYFLQLKNARKYKTDIFINEEDKIPVDIDCLPLWNGNSIAHQAMQFALWCNPKRIFLVGCDCNGVKAGHFIEGKNDKNMVDSFSEEFWKNNQSYLINGWKKLKDFADAYYPNTKIISINPVGLKGVFEDMYQNKED